MNIKRELFWLLLKASVVIIWSTEEVLFKSKMSFISKVNSNLAKLLNSSDLFTVEKYILKYCGIWPCDKINLWKVWGYLVLHFIMIMIPQINCFIKSFNTKNYIESTEAAPRAMISIIIIYGGFNVLIHKDKFKTLVFSIEENWNKFSSAEYPKSRRQQHKILKIGHACIISGLCIIHIISLCLNYIPAVYHSLRFTLTDLDIMDPSIDRSTFWKVE